jgi:hypothetical protein
MKANKTYTQNEKTSQEFFYKKTKWKMKTLPSLERKAWSSPLWDLHRKFEGDEVEYQSNKMKA